MWEQAQFKFLVEILGDDLRVVIGFEHNGLTVLDDRHAVVTLAGQFPDERAVVIGDVNDLKRNPRKFQDALLRQAERAPWKLNQLNHCVSGCPQRWACVSCCGFANAVVSATS